MPTVQTSNDRLKAALARVLQSLIGSRLDFLAYYPGVATNQNADGTLDIIPDDPRIPSVQGVPIRYGIPGVTATIANGARVLLGWAGGDPSKPIATVWESASVTAITFAGTTVNVGGASGLQGCGLGDQLTTALSNIVTWLTTHTHIVPITGPAGATTSAVAVLGPPTIGTVTSATVKVKP